MSSTKRKRSFESSYHSSDIAEQYLRNKLHEHAFIPRQLGIDRRYEMVDADDIEGKPDLRIQKPNISVSGRTDVGYIEIKSKQNEDWMFICNQYQWEKYVEFASVRDIPVFVGWIHVDDDERRVYNEQYILVEVFDQTERVFKAPDGNIVVAINSDYAYNFNEMKELFLSEME